MLNITNRVIKELKKGLIKNHKDIDEKYKGKFLPYILEYINKIIMPDVDSAIKDLDDNVLLKSDLWLEAFYIESFCKWLDNQKNIIPVKKKQEIKKIKDRY